MAATLTSCTTSGLVEEGGTASLQTEARAKSIGTSTNPYEASGAVFAEIYEKLLDSVAEQNLGSILATAHTVNGFNTLYLSGYLPLTSSQIEAVVHNSKTNFDALNNILGMSPQGFGRLTAMVNGLQDLKNDSASYESAVSFILNLESGILTATDLTEQERRITLMTTALVLQKLDVEKRKKRKDRDWELSIGHIAATAYGATYSEPNAIISGLASLYLE